MQKRSSSRDQRGDKYMQPRGNSQQRPITQEEIRSQLTLLKAKRQQSMKQDNYNTNNTNYEEVVAIQDKKQIPINEFDDVDVTECPEGCGRKFNSHALEKHRKVCRTVFQQKRKQFDIKEHRILGDDHAQLLQEAELQQKLEQKKLKNIKQQPANRPIQGQKKSKWKAQSEAFRAMIKQQNGGEMTEQDKIVLQEALDVGRVLCEYCGRKFNDQAAQKHIPLCAQKAKMNALKTNKKPTKR